MRNLILQIGLMLITFNTFAETDSTRTSFFAPKVRSSKSKQQNQYFWSNSKEISFNVNTLISQFIPFNLKEVDNGISSIKTKWYGNKNAFRSEIGLNINNIDDDFLLYLGIGGEKRRNLHKNWHYTTGSDLFFLLDNRALNARNENLTLIGLNKFYGLEYHINNKFYFGSEARLSIGLGSDVKLQFLSPVAIFAGIRL